MLGELLVKCYAPSNLSHLYTSPSANPTPIPSTITNTNAAMTSAGEFQFTESISIQQLLPSANESEWTSLVALVRSCCSSMASLRPRFEDLVGQFRNVLKQAKEETPK
jgi:hypothetical protein